MDPRAVNQGLAATPFYNELGPQFSEYSGFTPSNDVQPNGAVAFARNSLFMKCIKANGDVDGCVALANRSISYKGETRDRFSEEDRKIVNIELCKGNPVILQVPSKNPGKSHFVLATGMSVDEDHKPIYITNNPSGEDGEREPRFANSDQVRGFRRYVPSADPSMIFIHLVGVVDMIVIDPQGRRTGYNPFTQIAYSEIPGATYSSAGSIGSPIDPTIFTDPETKFEGLEPLSGQYQIQVFAKANSNYQLVSYSFDTTGTINSITDKKGFIRAGASVQVAIQHSSEAIEIRRSGLKIERADFYDTRYRDMAFLSGVILPSDNRAINSVEKYIQVKVGPFVKSIEKKQLVKYKQHGHTIYAYGSFGKNELYIELDADTGEFKLFIGNIEIDDGDTSITTDVMVQVDNVIARNVTTFKEIRKQKIPCPRRK